MVFYANFMQKICSKLFSSYIFSDPQITIEISMNESNFHNNYIRLLKQFQECRSKSLFKKPVGPFEQSMTFQTNTLQISNNTKIRPFCSAIQNIRFYYRNQRSIQKITFHDGPLRYLLSSASKSAHIGPIGQHCSAGNL